MRSGLENRPAKRSSGTRWDYASWVYASLMTWLVACACTSAAVAPAAPPPRAPAPMPPCPSPQQAPQRAATVPDPLPARDHPRYQALRLDAQATLHAFSNRSASWSPDRRSVVFLSDRDGAWRAYVSGWRALSLPPRAVHGPPGPIVDADFHPAGRNVFLLEAGRTGASLHLADPARGTFEPWGPPGLHAPTLPRRPSLARHSLATFAHEPKRVLLGSADSPAQHVIALADNATVAALSPDGKRLLLVETGGEGDAIAELDWSGQRRLWLEPQAERRVRAATYAPDGRSVLFAAAVAPGPVQVLKLGKAGQAPASVYETEDAFTDVVALASAARSPNVAALLCSPKGMAVELVQPSGYRKPQRVGLPAGVGSLGRFSRDGKVLTLTWETPESPPDIYEVATDSGRLRKLRTDVRPALARLDGLRWRNETVAAEGHSFETTLYEPDNGQTRHPVVLLIGQEGPPAPAWRPEVRFLVGAGFVVIEPWTPCGKEPEPPTCQHLTGWIDALRQWLPTQPWWAEGQVAVIGRERAHRQVLEATPIDAPAWTTVVNPAPNVGVPMRPSPKDSAWNVLVSSQAQDSAQYVDTLRGLGAHVQYAVSPEPAARLAREALFLQRAFPTAP